jgi:hypothetical protein
MASSRRVVALEVSSAAVETLAAASWMAYNRQAERVEASVADFMMVAVDKIYSKASVGVWMGIGVSSSAAVALVIMLDAAKWATINRLVECRYIAVVVRVVVKAVVLAAVGAAAATVAEVKDKSLRSTNSDNHNSINSSNNICEMTTIKEKVVECRGKGSDAKKNQETAGKEELE